MALSNVHENTWLFKNFISYIEDLKNIGKSKKKETRKTFISSFDFPYENLVYFFLRK